MITSFQILSFKVSKEHIFISHLQYPPPGRLEASELPQAVSPQELILSN